MRIAIASEFVGQLEVVRAVYEGSEAVAPTAQAASQVALGDISSLLPSAGSPSGASVASA
jgi:hypothetical protein